MPGAKDLLAAKLGGTRDPPTEQLTMKQRLAQKLNSKKGPPANSFAARLAAKVNGGQFNQMDRRRETIRPGSREATSLSKEVTRPAAEDERALMDGIDENNALEGAQVLAVEAAREAEDQTRKAAKEAEEAALAAKEALEAEQAAEEAAKEAEEAERAAQEAEKAAAKEAEEAAQAAKEAEEAEKAAQEVDEEDPMAAMLIAKAAEAKVKAAQEKAEAEAAAQKAEEEAAAKQAAEAKATEQAEQAASAAKTAEETEATAADDGSATRAMSFLLSAMGAQEPEPEPAPVAKAKVEAKEAEETPSAPDADADPMAAMLMATAARVAKEKASKEKDEADAAASAVAKAKEELEEKERAQKEKAAAFEAAVAASPADDLRREDLESIGVLGAGTFGMVSLVKHGAGVYALKQLSKAHIVDSENQESVMREKEVMSLLSHWSCVTLTRTFHEPKFLYFLMPVCLGGEMFAHLRVMGEFDNTTTRFYAACVTVALEHLQTLNIVYRDMKPENCMLDMQGYLKIIDFGCAKVLDDTGQTFSMCGTPDYTAPEMIIGDGHGLGVDWWSLGILVFEMLNGKPPFLRVDPVQTYTDIVQLGQKCIDFPKSMSKASIDLVRRLLLYNPERRLGIAGGAESVKKHAYFKVLDWDALEARTLEAPIDVDLDGPEDLQNFRLVPLPDSNEFDEFLDQECDWDPDF